MVLSKSLLVKGLLGGGALAGTTTLGIVYGEDIGRLFGESEGVLKLSNFMDVIDDLEIKRVCQFSGSEEEKNCGNLGSEKISNIKFNIPKSSGKKQEVKGLDGGDPKDIRALLKVEKVNDKQIFSSGYKYTFEVKGEGVIVYDGADESKKIVLHSGTNPEFTVENGRLVMAWDAKKLGKKVGLTCVEKKIKEVVTNECSFEKQIKVIKENTVQELIPTEKDKKITFVGETSNFNQGFKFVVPEGGIKGEGDEVILEGGWYEIKNLENNGWGLLRKNTQNNA